MKNPVQLTKSIDPVRNWRTRSLWRRSFLLIPLALGLACFALSPPARAVCQEGCLSVDNTMLGEDALLNNTDGNSNTAIGSHALFGNTNAHFNTALGSRALYSNTTGINNTACGQQALYSNTTGSGNTAVGSWSLLGNTTGDFNVAIYAMGFNVTGSSNTGVGAFALDGNVTGSFNTASGYEALYNNDGNNNTATGALALRGADYPGTGSFNTATGYQALYSSTTGSFNTATGNSALYGNTTGGSNTADGGLALSSNTTGNDNTGIGFSALVLNTTGLSNTAVGREALLRNTTGGSNIALGFAAGSNLTTGSNNIDIGNAGVAGESRKIRLGMVGLHRNTYIAGIYGTTVSRGISVIVDPDGHLGTTTSSARFKEKIEPMDKASEAILALQPVTFRYKHELDPDGIPQFGLVAEEVAKVNPDLVVRDEEGKPYTVRYEAVNAMLLNEFLKEHRRVQELESTITQLNVRDAKQDAAIAQQQKTFEFTIAQQQKEIAVLTSTLQEQASQIQKVSARLTAADQAAPRLAVNDQ